MSVRLLLLLVALILFICSAVGAPSSRVNLQSLGLACWVAALLLSTP